MKRAISWVMVLAAWTAAILVPLYVARFSKIGPVSIALSERHGIHEGDLVALAVCGLVAAGITWLLRRHLRGAPG